MQKPRQFLGEGVVGRREMRVLTQGSTPRTNVGFMVAIVALFAAGTLPGQSTWDRYRPGTISGVITEETPALHVPTGARTGDVIRLSGGRVGLRVMLRYMGRGRAVSEDRIEVIRRWAAAFGSRISVNDLFRQEYLFIEGDRELWLPVQSPVESYLRMELRPGDSVTVFVAYVGARRRAHQTDWIFVVNEFQQDGVNKE